MAIAERTQTLTIMRLSKLFVCSWCSGYLYLIRRKLVQNFLFLFGYTKLVFS